MQTKPTEIVQQEQSTQGLVAALQETKLSRENYAQIMGILVQCKANSKALEAQRDEALTPAKNTVKRIKGYFDHSLGSLGECERVIKEKATSLLGAVAASRLTAADAGQQVSAPLPEVPGVGVREGWDFKILDSQILPYEYMQPDEKKIRASIKEQMLETGPRPIPGVKFFRKFTLVVTPPKG